MGGVTSLTIEYDAAGARPLRAVLNRDDGGTEYYVITGYSGAGLGNDVRHYDLGNRVVSDPQMSDLDQARPAGGLTRG